MNIFRNLIAPGQQLSHRVVRSSIWLALAVIIDRVLSIGRMVVLARLLSPHDFGLFSICLLALLFVDSVSRTGLQSALIQKKGNIDLYLDSAWTVQVVRGFILAVALFFGAGVTANFFDAPEARTLLQVIAATMITRGLYNPGTYYFQKDLEFHKQFILRMAQGIIALILPIPLTFLWHNAWGLIVGVIAGDLCALIASYVLHPYRPHFRIDLKQIKALMVPGKWFALTSLIAFLGGQIDKWGVGNLLGPTSLGLYQVGSNMSTITSELSQTVWVVSFPAFAKLQDSPKAIQRAFFRIWEISASVTLPLAIILFVLAEGIVKVLFGEVWLPAVPAIKILAISSFLIGLSGISGSYFNGAGLPKFNSMVWVVQIVVTACLIYPFIKLMGMVGGGYSVLAGVVASFPLMFKYLFMDLHISPREMAKASLTPLVLGLVVFSANFLITLGLDNSKLLGLVEICIFDILIYGAVSYLLWRRFNSGPFQTLAALKNSWNTRAKTGPAEYKAE